MSVNASFNEQFGLSVANIAIGAYKRLNIRNMQNNHWIVSHVVRGRLTMETGNETYSVEVGQVMIHPPNVPFNECNASDGLHHVLFLSATLSDRIDLLRVYPLPPVVTLSDEPAYIERFRELFAIWHDPAGPFRELRIGNGVLSLLTLLLQSWDACGRPPRPETLNSAEDRFMEVIHYMQSNLHRKITREELSSLLHLHPNYFDKLFAKHLGQTPMHLLRSLRLRKAQSLLETSEDTLERIASECGLVDAAYLGRTFRGQFGETPGQYRERMRRMRSIYGEA